MYRFLFIFLLFSIQNLSAQDERFYRDLFSGTLDGKLRFEKAEKKYKWKVHTPFYEVDLTGDGRKEAIVIEKKDGIDWINIHDEFKAHVFKYKMHTQGADSKIYRINVRNLSDKTRVLVIHYYEGRAEFLDFIGSARLYFLTIDNKDIKTASMYMGPAIWLEKEDYLYTYKQRKYKFELFDYNQDGQREIVVKYHKVPRVFMYQSKGQWAEL